MKLLRQYIREICGDSSVDIDDALATANLAHLGQMRRSGGAYIEHPKEVANLVYAYYGETTLCAAALLHDALEDAPAQGNVNVPEEMASMIAGSFGDPDLGNEILSLVQALTHQKSQPYTEYVLSLASNSGALKIKLADMLHNISTGPSKRQLLKYRTALEALQAEHGDPPTGISPAHWKDITTAAGLVTEERVLREYIRTLLEVDFGKRVLPWYLKDPTGIERHSQLDLPKKEREKDTEDEFKVYLMLRDFISGGQVTRTKSIGGHEMDAVIAAMDDPRYNDVFVRYTGADVVRGVAMAPEQLDKIFPRWRVMVDKFRQDDPQQLGIKDFDIESEEPHEWGDEPELWSSIIEIDYTYMSKAGAMSHWSRSEEKAREFAMGDWGGPNVTDYRIPVVLYASSGDNEFLDLVRLYQYDPFNNFSDEQEAIGFGPINISGIKIYYANYVDLGKVSGTREDMK